MRRCICKHYENNACYAPIPGWLWDSHEINTCKSHNIDPESCVDCYAFESKKGDL
jgi:hypothetical protein